MIVSNIPLVEAMFGLVNHYVVFRQHVVTIITLLKVREGACPSH